MTNSRKDKIHTLLKGIETGDPASVTVVNEAKYIQHNPQTHEGSLGLAALFKQLSKTSPQVNIVRIFEDGDYVFGHTEYDFSNRNIGFEVFRFEGDQAVEHWDNIQRRKGPNASGHSMVDGPTEATDHTLTEANRTLVKTFVEEVLIEKQWEQLEQYIDDERFTQHHPEMTDGLTDLHAALINKPEVVSEAAPETHLSLQYDKLHRVLAEGNFVLAVNEGYVNGVHSALYDLYRVAQGKLVEHWATIETIPDRSEWKNVNGKF